jgi:5'-nucleotidase
MSSELAAKLVVAISSRALFDLDESHQVFETQGLDAYRQYQIEHEDKVLEKGGAFALVEKLLRLNQHKNQQGQTLQRVEVILLSRNSSDTGLRVFNSIQHYGLPITRAAFTGGVNPYKYVPAFGGHLFLSINREDVELALQMGMAAATILPSKATQADDNIVRLAFDGDAVLFSDESERTYQSQGLTKFAEIEKAKAHEPLLGGPFKSFLSALNNIQSEFPERESPIRTALVTARSAPAHERVVRTLRSWNIRIDESLFLGGLSKAEFLKAFGADIFFDDQRSHCEKASQHVATAHVPHGVINEKFPS